jgi:hypothetical protein
MAEKQEERRTEKWHVGKEIPIAIIFAITVQTMGGIWFAATYVAKIDTLTSLMSEFKATQYTQEDARRDKESSNERNSDIVRRIERLEGVRNMSRGTQL